MANLNRFIYAQDEYGFSSILEDLKLGRKVGHWMRSFSQMKGFGAIKKH
jgi:uncharacterized protein (DUF1810 family)